MSSRHYTIATRDGVAVPLCAESAPNIYSSTTPWAFNCLRCMARFEKLERMARLDQVDYMQKVVCEWETRRLLRRQRHRK